ncbi:hypothetical protein SAMN05444841_11119 [Enterobacter kobei]|jgi:hypothetical protein|nr:hypothetical protein SAMN05444841_11119 [Enterobacter kobei]
MALSTKEKVKLKNCIHGYNLIRQKVAYERIVSMDTILHTFFH